MAEDTEEEKERKRREAEERGEVVNPLDEEKKHAENIPPYRFMSPPEIMILVVGMIHRRPMEPWRWC